MTDLQQRLKKTLYDLFAFNEVYPDEREVVAYTNNRLQKAGFAVELDSFRNIIAKKSGAGEPVLFSTHMDIPEPAPAPDVIEEGTVLRSAGKSILGVDPKSGLAMLLDFADELVGKTHSPIEMLITRGEEAGLCGALNADYSTLSAKIGLVLDEDGPITNVVTQAPAFVRFDCKFVGKVVHPREPELGINALQMAARAMEKVPCGYSKKGVTWNIGMFQSGTARNSVPGEAMLQAELRSFESTDVESEGERIADVFNKTAQEMGGSCVVDKEFEFHGYKLEPTHPLFKRLEETFRALNLKPNYYSTFGGSDANVLNAHGILTVPIGSGYYNAHQYTEYADLADMEQGVEFLKKFVSAN